MSAPNTNRRPWPKKPEPLPCETFESVALDIGSTWLILGLLLAFAALFGFLGDAPDLVDLALQGWHD